MASLATCTTSTRADQLLFFLIHDGKESLRICRFRMNVMGEWFVCVHSKAGMGMCGAAHRDAFDLEVK